MYGKFQKYLSDELAAIRVAGLYKKERNIASPQSAEIELEDGSKALNFCANNYLGLADNPRLVKAAEEAMKGRGYGMSSVRFICGTQDIHKRLEKAISEFFKTEDITAVTVADKDVILASLGQLQLMTQSGAGVGLGLNITHAGEILVVLGPPT